MKTIDGKETQKKQRQKRIGVGGGRSYNERVRAK